MIKIQGSIPVSGIKISEETESPTAPEAVSEIKIQGDIPEDLSGTKFAEEVEDSEPLTLENWIKVMGLFTGKFLWGVDTGSANAREVTFNNSGITAWSSLTGIPMLVKSSYLNTGAVTLAVNDLEAVDIKKRNNDGVIEDLEAGDITVGMISEFILDDEGVLIMTNPASAFAPLPINVYTATLNENGECEVSYPAMTADTKIMLSPSSGRSNMQIIVTDIEAGTGFKIVSAGLDYDAGLEVNWFAAI